MGKYAIGIDLGTTNSCVAVVENGEPVVIPNDEGHRTTPSIVGFTADGERLVGQIARRQAVTNSESTIFASKRLIGRKINDDEVRHCRDLVPYSIVPHENDDAWIEVHGDIMAPTEISAVVLDKMKAIAEAYVGEEVTEAVITVPAYFNDAQRQATKDAGRIAGLEVKRIINEPTAAALAYGLGKQEHEKIAVFDLGGGTFDISILELDSGVFQVKATNGDTFLGGEDFDNRIIEYVLNQFQETNGIDLRSEKVAMQRIKEACEDGKKKLSTAQETTISLPFIASDADRKPLHLEVPLSREELESLVADLIERLALPCEACMTDARISASELNSVLLVGGMTRMPRVQSRVEEIFHQPPNRDVNPDEVVAVGAAIQASVLKGEVKDVLLVDVTPLTMGIEVSGGLMEPIIERNTTIPVRKSKVFTTALDNQDMVRVKVLQGEREMADDNNCLGTLELHGLPPAPRGIPEIEVAFEIDADGILRASAKDRATGRKQDLRIVPTSGLSDTEIQDMIKSRERYRGDDQKRRELAEAKNQLDNLIYTTSRHFEDFGDMLTAEDEEAIQIALDDAEDAMDGNNLEEVQNSHDALFDAAQRLGTSIYEQTTNTGEKAATDDEDSIGDIDDILDDDFLNDLDDFDEDEDTFG